MSVQLAPSAMFQAFGPNGQFLVGGQLFTYAAGTTTPQATYVDSTQTTPNTNPVILNAMGQASVWLDVTLSYKFVLQDSAGNPLYTQDNISGALFATSLTLGPPASGSTLTLNGSPGLTAGQFVETITQTSNVVGTSGLLVTSSVANNSGIAIRNSVNAPTTWSELSLRGGSGTDNVSFVMTNNTWAATGFGIAGLPAGQVGILSSVPGTHGAFPMAICTNNAVQILVSASGAVTITGTLSTTGAVATGPLTVTGAAAISGNISSANVLTGTVAATGSIGMNGATPPAQVTGWGTPTGPAVVNNYSGTAATLVQTSNAVAEIITVLKAFGLLGA